MTPGVEIRVAGLLWLCGVCMMSGGLFLALRGEVVLGTAVLALGILVGPGGAGLLR